MEHENLNKGQQDALQSVDNLCTNRHNDYIMLKRNGNTEDAMEIALALNCLARRIMENVGILVDEERNKIDWYEEEG